MRQRRAAAIALFAVVCAVLCRSARTASASNSGVTSAQIDAGYLADVRDLKTTVTYASADDRTDVSLALVPPVPTGGPGITLIFRARFRGRSVNPAQLDEIVLRAHYTIHSDDRRRTVGALTTSHELQIRIDPQDAGGISLAFYPATWGYFGFAAPGDEIPVAFFSVTPADLRALSLAHVVTGEVLWTRFSLTAEEIAALQQFAATVLPPQPKAG
jgi:hypothetical protein